MGNDWHKPVRHFHFIRLISPILLLLSFHFLNYYNVSINFPYCHPFQHLRKDSLLIQKTKAIN